MTNRYTTDQQQVLADLARGAPAHRQETSALVAPGGGVWACAVTIQSRVYRNVYLVRAVVVGEAGSIPVEVGDPVEATNLAEAPQNPGTLPSGAHAILIRLGETNVFYAKP